MRLNNLFVEFGLIRTAAGFLNPDYCLSVLVVGSHPAVRLFGFKCVITVFIKLVESE